MIIFVSDSIITHLTHTHIMIYAATVTSYPVRHLQFDFATGSKLINTDYILDMKLSGTDDALIKYSLRKSFDRDTKFSFIISETLANVVTGSNVSSQSKLVALPVFEDDKTSSTAVTHYFNDSAIAWCEAVYGSTTTSYVYVQEGTNLNRYIVDYNLSQILDIIDTGATTTTTTTTTTTGA